MKNRRYLEIELIYRNNQQFVGDFFIHLFHFSLMLS